MLYKGVYYTVFPVRHTTRAPAALLWLHTPAPLLFLPCQYHKLPSGKLVICTPGQLQLIIEGIMIAGDASAGPSASAARLAALTTMERTAWATARENFFSHGVNKASLREIEAAVFILALDPVSFACFALLFAKAPLAIHHVLPGCAELAQVAG